MEEVIKKLTSYNLFNNLLPGTIFAVFVKEIGHIVLIYENIVVSFFVYYFIGVVIGRFSSIVVEGFLKATGVIKFRKYSDFIIATDTDPKIEILSETKNMYRSFLALFILISLVTLYKHIIEEYLFSDIINNIIIVALILILFFLSFLKQNKYINERIDCSTRSTEE